jgi:hypothetical protein
VVEQLSVAEGLPSGTSKPAWPLREDPDLVEQTRVDLGLQALADPPVEVGAIPRQSDLEER